jgi:hypothetical protein
VSFAIARWQATPAAWPSAIHVGSIRIDEYATWVVEAATGTIRPSIFLRDHDAVGDLVGPRDVVEHPQVPFQHQRVAGLTLAAREAVDGELAHGDGVRVSARRTVLAVARDVVLGEQVLADESPRLAHVQLEGEVAVVGELVLRQVILLGELPVRGGDILVVLQEP